MLLMHFITLSLQLSAVEIIHTKSTNKTNLHSLGTQTHVPARSSMAIDK